MQNNIDSALWWLITFQEQTADAYARARDYYASGLFVRARHAQRKARESFDHAQVFYQKNETSIFKCK